MFKKSKRLLTEILLLTLLLNISACSRKAQPAENQQSGWGNAHWVWKTETFDNNDWGAFKRKFELKSVPETAEIKIACDSKYWLYVNGALVVNEGGLKRGPNSKDTYYDTIDAAPFLQEGINDFSVLVWYWGPGSWVTHYRSSGRAGLLVSTQLVDAESGKTVETGDGLWWAATEPAYLSGFKGGNAYLGESSILYDARKETNWTAADYIPREGEWKLAANVGDADDNAGYAGDSPWNTLVQRPIPQWKDYGLTTVDVSQCAVSENNGETQYEIQLPYNMQIYPYLKLGEGTEEGAIITANTETYSFSQLQMQYTTRSGAQAYESKGWINGDRLTFSVPNGVEVICLGYRQTGYAIKESEQSVFAGTFNSTLKPETSMADVFSGGWTWSAEETSRDNNFYDEVWAKAAYSLYVCMRDSYMDCPDRERGQYIGDAINEIEEAFYALGPEANNLSAKAIREICAGQVAYRYQGKVHYAMSSIEPIEEMHEIPIQALGTAVAAWNYYLFTGDKTVPQDCFAALYNYLTNYDFETAAPYEGTVRMRGLQELRNSTSNKNLVVSKLDQWSDWGDNQDSRIAVTCWWYLSAKAVRALADVDGVDVTESQIMWLDEGLKTVEENFSKFWNEELQAYATDFGQAWNRPVPLDDGTHLVDDRVNALAVVAGLVPVERYPALREAFMGNTTRPAYQNASIYMEKYVLEALCRMGYPEDAMERMATRYLPIVNDKSSSTLPEYWSEQGSEYEGTKNHGWSGGPLTVLSRCIGGIEPLEAGYSKWRVLPQIDGFDEVTVVVPAEIGTIQMTLSVSNGNTKMVLDSPGEYAQVYVPTINGAAITVTEGTADYLENCELYGTEYAVFEIRDSGRYVFESDE